MFPLKIFGEVKTTKAPMGFEIVTYIFLVNVLTHFATLFGNLICFIGTYHKIYLILLLISKISTSKTISYHFNFFL